MDTPESILDQGLELYRQGEIDDFELQVLALEHVPLEDPAPFLQRLPEGIVAALREFVVAASEWSDEEWKVPYILGEIEPTQEAIEQDRSRNQALLRYFDGLHAEGGK